MENLSQNKDQAELAVADAVASEHSDAQPPQVQAAILPQFVQDMISAGPPRAGEGVNLWLFKMARVLHPYRSPKVIAELLRANTAGCGRDVSEQEIQRAITNSKGAAWVPNGPAAHELSRCIWPKFDKTKRDAIAKTGGGLQELLRNSKINCNDGKNYADWVVDTLFPGDPLLCVGRSNKFFDTQKKSTWLGKLSAQALIVPNPMAKARALTQDGKPSAHTLNGTGTRRFLVIEFDEGSVNEQSSLLLHLAESAPLALAVFSGSKSLHGWFYCQGQDEKALRQFMNYAVSLGADKATWTKSQFVRMPFGVRDNGILQPVWYMNPEVIK